MGDDAQFYYVIERCWPGFTVTLRGGESARRAGSLHTISLRPLGSLLVPGDEVAPAEFTAASSEEIVRTSRDAAPACDRVAEPMWPEAAVDRPSRIATNAGRSRGRSRKTS